MAKKTTDEYKKENREMRRIIWELVMIINNISPAYWRDFLSDGLQKRIERLIPKAKEY